jgi:hypothetical protein
MMSKEYIFHHEGISMAGSKYHDGNGQLDTRVDSCKIMQPCQRIAGYRRPDQAFGFCRQTEWSTRDSLEITEQMEDACAYVPAEHLFSRKEVYPGSVRVCRGRGTRSRGAACGGTETGFWVLPLDFESGNTNKLRLRGNCLRQVQRDGTTHVRIDGLGAAYDLSQLSEVNVASFACPPFAPNQAGRCSRATRRARTANCQRETGSLLFLTANIEIP